MSEVLKDSGMVTPMHRYSAGMKEEEMILYLFCFPVFFLAFAFIPPYVVKIRFSALIKCYYQPSSVLWP